METPRSGPARWFAAEVQPHESALRGWLARRFSDTGEIDDIVQEACLRVLRASESGPGLAPAHIARLFRPFSRSAPQPSGGETSHGLGLSIAHEIVRLHGGTLSVTANPGAGATFTVVLPA